MNHELGVAFECVFHGEAEERTLDDFVDMIETRGWQYGGGWTPAGMSGVVQFGVTDWDAAERCRIELRAWLNRSAWVASVPEMRVIDLDV